MQKRLSTGLLAVACLCASIPARAGDDQAARLNVRARALSSDGRADNSAASPHRMVVGQGITSYLFATDTLCGLGGAEVTAQNLEELLRRKMHVWKVTRTGVGHANGKITFDLEWSRFDKGSGVPAASGKYRLSLAEGAVYPIDMVRAPGGGGCDTAAVVVEVEAGTIESAAHADETLYYDLWLKYDDGTGKKETRHFVATGKHGAAVPFDFSPLRFDMPTLTANQYDLDLVTRVQGAIRGRIGDNRTVTIELDTKRMDRLERADDPTITTARGSGRKVLELTFGETVEIELPAVTGFASHAASADATGLSGRIVAAPGTAPPAPAVSLSKDGHLVVRFKEFFEGDRFSVLVRVRKEP